MNDQTKSSHETHFHGSVTGPIHTGSGNINIGSSYHRTETSLRNLLPALRHSLVIKAPVTMQSKVLEQNQRLTEALYESEPDLDLIESTISWFQKHLPALAEEVLAVIFHPIVVQHIEASGEAIAAEFHKRFGRLRT